METKIGVGGQVDFSDFTSLIDKLEDTVTTAKHIPMTGSVVLTEQNLFDLVDEMRQRLPEELKHARWVVKERQEIVKEAEKEADRLIDESKEQAEQLVVDSEIVKQSETRANEIIDAAKAKEREVRLQAEDYADEMLANLEVNLGKLLTAVQRGRDRLQGKVEAR